MAIAFTWWELPIIIIVVALTISIIYGFKRPQNSFEPGFDPVPQLAIIAIGVALAIGIVVGHFFH